MLAAGDGALGFWAALAKVFPSTKHQRCWVHKTANILNKLPKSQQAQAKKMLHEIWLSATREDAFKAFDLFVQTYQAKYPRAVECLLKDREQLLAFYDFPAEHWSHLRTTNPIESTFPLASYWKRVCGGAVGPFTAELIPVPVRSGSDIHWSVTRFSASYRVTLVCNWYFCNVASLR